MANEDVSANAATAGGSNAAAAENYTFGYYVVSLVDILNQSEALSKIDFVPDGPADTALFITNVKKTVGTVLCIRQAFSDFFGASQGDAEGA